MVFTGLLHKYLQGFYINNGDYSHVSLSSCFSWEDESDSTPMGHLRQVFVHC